MTGAPRLQAHGTSARHFKVGLIFGDEEFSRRVYRRRVTEWVARLMPRMSVTDLYHSCLGAFPAIVKQSLLALEVHDFRPRPASLDTTVASDDPAPWEDEELDIVDFQWLFDVPSVERILAAMPSGTTSLAALGAPTVAALAASRIRDVQLVDISARYQPGGHPPAWIDLSKVRALQYDLDEPMTGLTPADMVVMDPPWHLEHYLAWLRTAVATCKPGGLLAVALPQRLTNRKSEHELVELTEILGRIGNVSLMRNALSYVTPSFEAAVLDADGLGSLRRWRRADLALVHVLHPDACWDVPKIDKLQWTTWRWLEGQVVRTWGEAGAGDPHIPQVVAADPVRGYWLASVGRTYLWSSEINLVTSQGRAAVVSRWGRLPQILDRIGDGYPAEAAIKEVLSGAPAGDLERLTATIHTLLGR